MTEKTYIPDDFKIEESVRSFTEVRWGVRSLPDQFIGEFKERYQGMKEDKDPKGRHINWNRALMNWILWTSPGQRFYNPNIWEHRLNEAKKIDYMEKPHFEVPVKKTPVSKKPDDFDKLRESLRLEAMQENRPKPRIIENETMPEQLERELREKFIRGEKVEDL